MTKQKNSKNTTKKLRILSLDGAYQSDTELVVKGNSEKYDLTHYYYRKDYGLGNDPQWFWTWEILDAHYKAADPHLLRIYKKIEELADDFDIMVLTVGDMMHPDFIKKLSKRFGGKIFTIYCVDGEPASSSILSHPVVKAFDFASTCSIMYDERRTNEQMLIANGAYGASWVAVGTKYNKEHKAWNSPIEGRKKDVIFLGCAMEYQLSDEPFPPNKYKFIKSLEQYGVKVDVLEWKGVDEAAEIYKDYKVGVNMHGPSPLGIGSAQRTWDLAANGVALVSDGAGLGIDRIFTNEECSSFMWSNPEEAAYHIKDLLNNDEKRISKATKARERTAKEYCNDLDNNYLTRILDNAIKFWKEDGLWEKR